MKTKICIISLLLALNVPAWAALYSYGTLAGGSAIGTIPDNNTIGFTDAHTLSGLGTSISDLTLTIALQGGFSTDLSGYIRLGNLTGSPYYNLTTLIQGQTLSESSATTYAIDFTTTGFQSTFNGQNPNDAWTLFFADSSPGGVTTLNGWSLGITAVPEPITLALPIFGVLMLAIGLVRRLVSKPASRPA
jgi:hypothetical protein